jgi:hypothetical protein
MSLLETPIKPQEIKETLYQAITGQPQVAIIDGLKDEYQEIVNRLLIDNQIIIYSNRIYITKHSGNKLIRVKDYYLYKSGKTDEYDIEFHLDINKKHLINYNDPVNNEYRTKLFYGFLSSIKIIEDTSDENLGKIHLELLKTRLYNKVIPSISKEEILVREEYHRTKILKDINLYIEKISPNLYKMADDGIQILRLCFDDINDLTITDSGKMRQFSEYPCSDGKIRNTFIEYFYFILEKAFKREEDDISDQDWIGIHLVEKCRKIYPHLHFSYEVSKSLLPKVILNLNIDIMNVWL